MRDERLEKLARILVNYSTEVKPGDFVYVRADEVATPWAKAVVREAVKAGGHVEVVLTSEEINEVILKESTADQLHEGSLINETLLARADVWLTAWGSRNPKYGSNIDAQKVKDASIGAKGWRKFYSERMGDGSLRWCGTQFPAMGDAQEAGMSLEEYEDFVYGAGLLNEEDPAAEWRRISKEQDRWVAYLNTKKSIRIVTADSEVVANVEGRTWVNCDGKLNFPDGEIYTSPVEDGVDGHVYFEFPLIYSGKEIQGIRLKIEKGRITEASAEKGEDLLLTILDTDEGARTFGELAIGTNYGIQKITKNILFDEKIGGTFHMAIGDSFPEAGGKNRSVIHWDMIGELRKGGKIYGDGELFHENGHFLPEVLEKFEAGR
ncbi:aminopeptidase [Proteiniclasticum sp. BAD-10]|uniref:Aminopeptidase n=1 Tax=Proteiniclasticum sediminis TaxID=2804028 RepID=A0A941HR43_9CLOT|nr:aminopeptidase [Proteiniclasticum sediminis]MBR0577031.1 aminopeptidase [Proteiniclasticum sediminis]